MTNLSVNLNKVATLRNSRGGESPSVWETERLGVGLNAGRDLNLQNLGCFVQTIPNLKEVSIGHALISDALYYGFENTIRLYLRQLNSRNKLK